MKNGQQGFPNIAQRIKILQFGSGAELLTGDSNRNIRLAAKMSFFHIGIRDFKILKNLAQILKIIDRLFRTSYIRFGDNLNQRHAFGEGFTRYDHISE